MTSPADDLADFAGDPAKPKRRPGRPFSWIELLIVLGIIAVLTALMLPATRTARPAARRAQCINNLKQIALGLHNYESVYNALPPAYTVNAAGRPLHSWRTLILPYLEQGPLYKTIDLSKPWDDPANAKARATVISTYVCPALSGPATATPYLAIVAPGGCFLPAKSRRSSEITDARGTTLMVIEVPRDRAVHWMAPSDADERLVMGIGPGSKLDHAGGMNAAFADGSVRSLRARVPAAQRRAMISIAGRDDEAARD